MSSNGNDEKRSSFRLASSCPAVNWTLSLLTIGLTINLLLTGFMLLKLSNAPSQARIDALQTEVEKSRISKHVWQQQVKMMNDIFPESSEERAKRAASSPSQTSHAAVDVGAAFVSLIG